MQKLTLIALSIFFLGQGSAMAVTSTQADFHPKRECTSKPEDYCAKKYPGTDCVPGIKNTQRSWCASRCPDGACDSGYTCKLDHCHPDKWLYSISPLG